ncbi:MAG: monofunctional biosynthetic peptidoglycan transglycosylase [Marinibacterium sp.]|nr:monofunctional biosynthetic peptidoglycan transglycosylase [Marinibacterium sp.]
MAGKTSKSSKSRKNGPVRVPVLTRLRRWIRRALWLLVLAVLALVLLFSVVNPPITHTMWVEKGKYGALKRDWVPMTDIAPVMARSVVAAEDANFCRHWGFDLDAIQAAIDAGASRGASTISQQVVKNVFLWQGRSWTRKALETALTPLVELTWSKRRILEVYLNVAEFGPGVFGVEAAAQASFGISAADLSATQAARLAAVLPNPRGRSVRAPSAFVRRRAVSIADGAATIRKDGRDDCFEN